MFGPKISGRIIWLAMTLIYTLNLRNTSCESDITGIYLQKLTWSLCLELKWSATENLVKFESQIAFAYSVTSYWEFIFLHGEKKIDLLRWSKMNFSFVWSSVMFTKDGVFSFLHIREIVGSIKVLLTSV